MKIVRLTTTDNNALFDNEFQSGLTLKPNSKIALQNLVCESVNNTLTINEGNDKLDLQKVVENNGIRKNQINKYKKLYEKLNILEITEKEINRYTNLALKSLNKIADSDAKENLRWLANSLIVRNK